MSQLPFDDDDVVPAPPARQDVPPRVPPKPRVPVRAFDSPAAPPPASPTAPAGGPAMTATGAHAAPAPAVPVAGGRRAVLSVSELSARLRGVIEEAFAEVWVEGEISNGRAWNSGHFYFTLKDAGAQMKGVMFRSTLRYLKFKPEDGLHVVARGRISLYEPKGEYQLVCEHMEPVGFGPLQLAFEQLKKKLAAEGLFDEARKRQLPTLPRRIGIVTSIDGAALRDIVRVLRRRYPNAHLVIAPTRVQGEGAAADIARAIRLVARVDDVDVVIVGRGGGSMEDLWAFNEEAVARAIAACPLPVISAVGHETDFTISDFVADVRAATPSAAAALAVPVFDDLKTELALLRKRGGRALSETARRARHELERARGRLGDPRRLLDERRQRLDDQVERGRRVFARRLAAAHAELRAAETRLYRAHPHRRISEQRGTLAAMRHRLETAMRPALVRRRHAIEGACGKLEALSPVRVLERGFSLTQRADGHVVTSAADLQPGERIHVRLHDGSVDGTVDSVSVAALDRKGDK